MKSLCYVPRSTDPGSDKNPCNLGIKIRRSRKAIQAIIKLTQYGSRRKKEQVKERHSQRAYSPLKISQAKPSSSKLPTRLIQNSLLTQSITYMYMQILLAFRKIQLSFAVYFQNHIQFYSNSLLVDLWLSIFHVYFRKKINRVSLIKKSKTASDCVLHKINTLTQNVSYLKNDLIQYFQVFEQIISLPLSPNFAQLKPTPTPPLQDCN